MRNDFVFASLLVGSLVFLRFAWQSYFYAGYLTLIFAGLMISVVSPIVIKAEVAKE